jgi:hypothetical protein
MRGGVEEMERNDKKEARIGGCKGRIRKKGTVGGGR